MSKQPRVSIGEDELTNYQLRTPSTAFHYTADFASRRAGSTLMNTATFAAANTGDASVAPN